MAVRGGDDGHLGHGRAQGHDFRRPLATLNGFHGALHDSPLAHAVLIDAAGVVEGFHGAVEDLMAQRLAVDIDLRSAWRVDDRHIEPLVTEQAFISGHEHRQVMNGIHHGNPHGFQVGLCRHDCSPFAPRLVG